jgi:hypothetical protein
MIIYGSRTMTSTRGQGDFFCPLCKRQRGFSHVSNTRWFTLYFIPIFPIYKQGEYVQCNSCGEGFAMEVLSMPAESFQPAAAPAVVQAGMEDMRRSMLLVLMHAQRTSPPDLLQLRDWCHSLGLTTTTDQVLQQELAMAAQAQMTFAGFAPGRLSALSPDERKAFVLAAKQLLCGAMRPGQREGELLQHVAYVLNVPPRDAGLA